MHPFMRETLTKSVPPIRRLYAENERLQSELVKGK